MIVGRSGLDRFFHPRLRPSIPYWQALIAYIPLLAAGVLPWTGLIPAAIGRGRNAARRGESISESNRVLAFCFIWFVVALIGLIASPGDKVYRYLVPTLVPLAVLMSAALDREPDRSRLSATACLVASVACVALWLALLWARSVEPATAALYMPIALPVAVVMTIAATAAGFAMVAQRPSAVIYALAAGSILTIASLQWSARARWDALWPWPRMATLVQEDKKTDTRAIVFGTGGPFSGVANAAAFYFDAPVAAVDDDAELVRLWGQPGLYAVLPREVSERLPHTPGRRVLVDSPLGWRLITNRPAGP
jgi:hypothetical protein